MKYITCVCVCVHAYMCVVAVRTLGVKSIMYTELWSDRVDMGCLRNAGTQIVVFSLPNTCACNTLCIPLICILLPFPFPSFLIFPSSPPQIVVTLLSGSGSSTAHIWGPWRPQCCQKGTHTLTPTGIVGKLGVGIVWPVYKPWHCVYTCTYMCGVCLYNIL